jgi:clan AA aspartic protease
VNVTVRRAGQPGIAIEFVIDTGFEGALVLPAAAVAALGLSLHQRVISKLADGSRRMTEVYRATIDWDGAIIDVAVLAMRCSRWVTVPGSEPLCWTATT